MRTTIWNKKKNFLLNYKKLKKELLHRAKNSDLKRSRVCVHLSKSMKVQEMFICAFKNSFMPPHKHNKNKTESYHIIEGTMDLFLFDKTGKVVDKISLKQNDFKKAVFYYRTNQGNFWHMPVVTSKFCIYHEIFSGPFSKKKNIIFPKWLDRIKYELYINERN